MAMAPAVTRAAAAASWRTAISWSSGLACRPTAFTSRCAAAKLVSSYWLSVLSCQVDITLRSSALLNATLRILAQLTAFMQEDEELSGEGNWSDLVQRRYRRMMVLAVSLPLLQQASGINSVTFYSSSVSLHRLLTLTKQVVRPEQHTVLCA